MKEKHYKRYLITAALPYANGLKHIGHMAGAYLPADIYVRYLRLQQRDVVFICGSDEHGAAITLQAIKENTTPEAIVEKYHTIVQENFKDLGISFDMYHRTSATLQHNTAQEFFLDLYKKEVLEEKESEQFYDEEYQIFLADRYIIGTCPSCNYNKAYGDQCEQCGTSLSPDQLIHPISTLSQKSPILKKTKHWYLPLQHYEDFLRKWILEEHKHDWRSNVIGQCKGWLDAGLQPRAVTRDLDWGIPVPLKEAKGKVLYVWFDAPIGYISATKQWAENNQREWKPYWYEEDTKLVHFIGKDNIVFHSIIFPIMLKRHGNILPADVVANEFMNLENDKMSTSRGWKVDMQDYINDFIKSSQGTPHMADVLRYYLTAIAPENKDSEFTWLGFKEANNNELVAILGNFIHRIISLTHNYCEGTVPVLNNQDDIDKQFVKDIHLIKDKITHCLEVYRIREAQGEMINLARVANKYLQEKQPWIVYKTLEKNRENKQIINNTIYLCLQCCANLTIVMQPFLPFSADILKNILNMDSSLWWKDAGSINLLKEGHIIGKPQLLFRKIEEEIEYQKQKLKCIIANAKEKEILLKPFKETIIIDDFSKLDLRIGTIIEAKKVEKSDKLLHLTVDLGLAKRTILSGIAKHFFLENLLGKQVLVVANLKPRKMMGIESHGMILFIENKEGKLVHLHSAEVVHPGSVIS
ncbi:MAG: methionine--tRNA ligase [Chitinophagaceae bacterium]